MRFETDYDSSEAGVSTYLSTVRDADNVARPVVAEKLDAVLPNLINKARELLGDHFVDAKRFSFANGEGLEYCVKVGTSRKPGLRQLEQWIANEALLVS